ncbi:Uncharacterized membrane protein, DUF441 family [Salinibacillus kushneri]|uniref:UPF0756 membrane protein SAMN05421676_10876 n=1 Tax=Salinibacillus kushneri TaxID=237682 RepID=A0A1I0H8V3_9BACI|nr:DUF441 domain-containing protein [Salinibacillus kushneri]SET79254.1 Uncharacterized membrane protein, DUF441 family [Salinibacillus kushneri]
MLSQSTIFLFILLLLGFIAKNQAIMVAVYILLGIKLFNIEDKVLPYLEAKGISIGVIVITVAVLAPIASGDIGFKDLLESIKTYYAWICLAAGIFVAYVAKDGLTLLSSDPHLTTALVIGTILGVVLFNGVAVGPLIGAGISFLVIKGVDFFVQLLA